MKEEEEKSSFKIATSALFALFIIFMFLTIKECRGQVTTSRAYWKNDSILVVTTASHYELNVPDMINKVDTIILMREFDVDNKFINGHIFKDNVILPFQGIGWVEFKSDKIIPGQSMYRFKRTKKFGGTTYEQLDAPFQFLDCWFEKPTDHNIVFRAKINKKQTHIISYVNGKKFKEFTPGHSYKTLDDFWTFDFGVNGKPGVEYKFSCEIKSKDGSIDVYNTKLKW